MASPTSASKAGAAVGNVILPGQKVSLPACHIHLNNSVVMNYRKPELLLELALFFLDSGTNIKWPLSLNNAHKAFKFQHPVQGQWEGW